MMVTWIRVVTAPGEGDNGWVVVVCLIRQLVDLSWVGCSEMCILCWSDWACHLWVQMLSLTGR